MSIITSQQLARYFDQYKNTEITFNKQVIEATGLLARNIYIKIGERQWPCIVYSSSMCGARTIAGVNTVFYESLRQVNNHASLHYSFKQQGKPDPISFFVLNKITGYTPYNPKNSEIQLIAMEFTQRPPDDLIQVLGLLLEANANSQRRKDERIVINPESLKKLGLESKESFVYVEGVPRKCIVRDLSFSGAKVLATGIAKFLTDKKASLKLSRGDPPEEFSIPAEITRVENVEGRKEIVALALQFSGDPPIGYKLMINGYLTAVRHGSAPPLARDTSPPPGRDTSPPLARDTSPPPGRDTSPPPGRDTSPPPGRDTSPPLGRGSTPPAASAQDLPEKTG